MSTLGEIDLEVLFPHAHHKYFDLTSGALQLGFSAVLYGYVLKNPSGSVAAAVDLYDSADGTGSPILPITFAASESVSDWFGPNGILFKNAIYANVTTGEVKGAILFRHVR